MCSFDFVFVFLKIKVLSLDGGAPKKKPKTSGNPFIDPPPPRHATNADAQLFERAFGVCVNIGQMDNIDPAQIIGEANIASLNYLKDFLGTGTAHHLSKIQETADLLPFIRELKLVEDMVGQAHEKYTKLMSGAMWNMGCNSKGTFNMDLLIGIFKGAITAKQQQPQQNNAENRANNAGLGM